MATEPNYPRPRGIYLLPNLFTSAGLFAGYFAIVKSMQNSFSLAAIAIFVAMITDFLDGRVARLTQTQTPFGMEYDSLSDMVSFGVAPSLVVYKWSLIHLGKFGWLVAFLFTAAVALRLARFNTQIANIDKRYFQGLSSPAGAGVIAAMVWFGHDYGGVTIVAALIIALITLCVAALMVSNIRYRSFKDVDLRGRIPFMNLLVIILIITGIAIDPPSMLFLIFFIYAISGPVHTLMRLRRARVKRKILMKKEAYKEEKDKSDSSLS